MDSLESKREKRVDEERESIVFLQRLSIFRLLSFFFTRGASLNACIHSSYIHAKEAVIYEGVNGFVKT